jgi:hypothetical protein
MTDKISNYEYRTPRFCADFSLWVQTGDRDPELLEARCKDLSEDGLAVEIVGAEINKPFEIGDRVILIMTLPGESTTKKIVARVTNQKASGYGFAFIFSSIAEEISMHEYFESQHRNIGRTQESSD